MVEVAVVVVEQIQGRLHSTYPWTPGCDPKLTDVNKHFKSMSGGTRNIVRQKVGGSEQYLKLTEDLPPGPRYKEMINYPNFIGSKIFCSRGGHDRLQRVANLVKEGVVGTYHFRGRGGGELSDKVIEVMMERAGLPRGWLRLYRCSEPKQDMLQLALETEGVEHGSQNIEQIYLQERDWKFLDSIDFFNAHLTKDAKIEKSSELAEYLDKHSKRIYALDKSTLMCACKKVPLRGCRVSCPPDVRSVEGPPIKSSTSGPPCQGFCPDGGKLQEAHPTELGRRVYMGMVKHGDNDYEFIENSHLFSWQDWVDGVKDANKIPKLAIVAPYVIGWPAGGERGYGCGMDPAVVVWIGTKEDDQTGEFLRIFFHRVDVDATVFADIDDNMSIQATREAYARRTDSSTVD